MMDQKQRITSLKFLVKANLISNPRVRDGLTDLLTEGERSVPRFLPIGAPSRLDDRIDGTGSAREKTVRRNPTLQGKNIALIGFRIRSGDVIDAVTPIYAEVTSTLELKGEFEGERIGGSGGGETLLTKTGYVVTGFDVQRGYYFGRSEVVHFQVIWNRMTADGVSSDDVVFSEKMGSGNYAQINEPPKQFRASAGAFISDFTATISHHTSGETFLNDIEISETVVVMK